MIFVKLSSSLAFNIFTISSDKSNRKKDIGKIFWRYSSLAHFPLPLQNSANLVTETRFHSKLKFLVEILNRIGCQGIS